MIGWDGVRDIIMHILTALYTYFSNAHLANRKSLFLLTTLIQLQGIQLKQTFAEPKMGTVNSITQCFPSRRTYNQAPPSRETQDVASNVVTIILTSDSRDAIKKRLDESISTTGWTESLAHAILCGLENAIKTGAQAAEAASKALARATSEAFEFSREHPIFVTILALGVLAILTPWVIEVLGFGELGPIEGSFAALWQRAYAGYVPKRSLFSFFQRLGMVWKHSVLLLDGISLKC
jgi:hypothetical protein